VIYNLEQIPAMHRPLTPSSGVAEDCNLLAVCMQAQYDYVQKGILTFYWIQHSIQVKLEKFI